MAEVALIGAEVFDGNTLMQNQAVMISGSSAEIVLKSDLAASCPRKTIDSGVIMPGFVDLQINGGGGIMFNDAPCLATLETMAEALHRLGTRFFLPTLITDKPEITTAAIHAVTQSIAAGVPGILGLHLEGPHLSLARKGAHDPKLIRQMTTEDLDQLVQASKVLPNLFVTLAPESASNAQIKALADAGICVSLGHTDTDYETALQAFEAGARCSTHLFNAMSQMNSRAPGLVGATLNTSKVSAGLIADGVHVHPATIRNALAAKAGPGEVFLVSDGMACAGSEMTEFTLNGRKILRNNGRLTLHDGTLAGADLNMGRAVHFMIEEVGDPPAKAYARATSIPASILPDPGRAGTWSAKITDLIHLSPNGRATALEHLIN